MTEWETNFLSTMAGNAIKIAPNTDLLETYLRKHGYGDIMGEFGHATNNSLIFRFKDAYKENFTGRIVATMGAPNNSHPGTMNEGAIPWLYLRRDLDLNTKMSSKQHKIFGVYQYHTAGGNPYFDCTLEGYTISVPYAAQYWIYESPTYNAKDELSDL